jgi:hypothetical protein
MAIQNPKRLISIDDYHRMAADGLFSEDDRVELIDGEILEMAPIGNRHATAVRRLSHLLKDVLGRRALIDSQNPVQLGDWSEPEPDIAALAWRDDYYAAAPPGARTFSSSSRSPTRPSPTTARSRLLSTLTKAFRNFGSSISSEARWRCTAGLHRLAIARSGACAEETRSPFSLSQTCPSPSPISSDPRFSLA